MPELPPTQRHAWTHDAYVPSWEPNPRPPVGAPNVIVMLLDDTGFAELGCYGSEVETPNIDRLAREGLQFTNFHTTTLCSPSRACLLTGRNHHAIGMRMLANVDSGLPSGRGRITPSAGTIAQVLRPIGYATLAVGKWHVAPMTETGPAGPYDHWPLQKGFERFYGFMEGAANHFYPELTVDNHRVPPPSTPQEGYHLTEDLVSQAISMMTDRISNDPGKPIFCYLAFGASHAPHQAPQAYLEKYRGRYERGYDAVRVERFERQLATGVVPAGTELPPGNPDVPSWAALTETQKLVACRLQEAYAAFVDHTDAQIGRVLDFLDRTGLADNTIVMLMSDNGAAAEGGPHGTVSRIRSFNGLPEDDEFNMEHLDTIGGFEGDNSYPAGWGQAGNVPGKWFKTYTHSGGIRDPLLVRWPAGVADPGTTRTQFHHIIDITPTLLDLIGVEMPQTLDGIAQMPMHGVSMKASMASASNESNHRIQYFEMFGNRGIYADGWKAVCRHERGVVYEQEPWELYHLAEDFSEAHDLAAIHPEKLQELIRLWYVEAGRFDVLPLDDRRVKLFQAPPSPSSPFARDRFVYFPGTNLVHQKVAPDLVDRSYTITVELEREPTDNGVLIAFGSSWSGYNLAIIDGHLAYEYNFVRQRTRIVSDRPIPSGRSVIRLEFEPTGTLTGRMTLNFDGVPCGSILLEHTLTMVLAGLEIGANRHGPVSTHFAAPFPFEGKIERVIYDLGPRVDPQ